MAEDFRSVVSVGFSQEHVLALDDQNANASRASQAGHREDAVEAAVDSASARVLGDARIRNMSEILVVGEVFGGDIPFSAYQTEIGSVRSRYAERPSRLP